MNITNQELSDSRTITINSQMAKSFYQLSFRLASMNRQEEARQATLEAVQLYRSLAEVDPEASNQDLAQSLDDLARYASALGDREEAMRAIEEAVELRQSLAKAHPEEFNPHFAVSQWPRDSCLGFWTSRRRNKGC